MSETQKEVDSGLRRNGKEVEVSERDIEAREVQLATLNILEDFNEEKERMANSQRAVLNILDDFDTEKSQLGRTQKATFNILEDFSEEKERMANSQRAVLNILDDFDTEKGQLERTQRATFNILEDFSEEKSRLENTQRAVLNILDDFDTEKGQLERTQRATFNILEDFNKEKEHLEDTQRAVLNILDDFDAEKTKVEQINKMLQVKTEELNHSNEELHKAHDILDIRVKERTSELQQSNERLLIEIEEHKKAEDEIKKLNDDLVRRSTELEASNKELESFSYSVSHDLRAPLRAMDGFSQAMMEDYTDKVDSTGKEYLNYIRSSSQLMAKLIDDLLNLSRITRVEMNLEKVDLSSLATEVAGELQRAQPERRVDFIIAPRLEALGDRHLLKLVLENLLGNALKFTSKRAEAKIEFGAIPSRDRQVFYIRDNGVGFDMAYVEKLFKPFQRLHRVEDFSGTGIGLASVQRIISRMGGRIWAEGEVDKGATFYFTLRG